MPIESFFTEKGLLKQTFAFVVFIMMLLLVFHGSSIERPKDTVIEKVLAPDAELSGTRFANRVVEDFNNYTMVDRSNTTCSVRSMDCRAYLWGSSPVIPPTNEGSMNMDTRSHGGGFSPKYNEFWYPHWSGSTIYRYTRAGQYLGTFNSGSNQMMQLWGDKDGTYYTANWGNRRIYKWSDRGNNQIWSYNLGSTAGSVCCDDTYVYAMRWYDSNVYVLRKDNGQHVRTWGIGATCYDYGTMAFANGILYIGGYNRDYQRVAMFTPHNNQKIGEFRVQTNIYNSAFDGENYCVSSNNANVLKYKISDGNAYLGDDVEPPTNITHFQSKILYDDTKTIGAAKMTWYEHKPQGTDVEYKLTLDGVNWVNMKNGTTHVFKHRGSPMRWNGTIKTNDKSISPYIDKVVIDYDLFSSPQPHLPTSEVWQGTRTPKLKWNFTDPDKNDH